MSSNFLDTMNHIETYRITYFNDYIEEAILFLNSKTVPSSALIQTQ